MKKICMTVLLLGMGMFQAYNCVADDAGKATDLVKKAVAYYKTNGMEKALDEFSNPKGQFRDRDLYVFAYDLTGTMLAHPNNTLIGQNMNEVPDPDGKFFRKEIVDIAKVKGSGWVNYKYQNPKTKSVEPKTTYLEKADELIICCGIYKK